MEIFPICENDAKQLAELDRRCFSVPWSEQSFLDECKNKLANYFVAKDNDKIIGYAGFWQVADEGGITNIAVDKEYRRKGIAKKLIEEMIKSAKEKDLSLLTLEVRKSNLPAISLYEKYGFKSLGIRKNYYKEPTEDAIIMTLYFGGIYG